MKFKAVTNSRPTAPDFLFFCPGCNVSHGVWFEHATADGQRWTWNGSLEAPTVQPSLLVTAPEWGPEGKPLRCHSFIERGRIRFLSDCTHSLAGQTVDLPDWEAATS